ncbi:hypothetical protein [Mesorhizobium sp.]|uniref:hypothetical protein n=1 Tax=Mesorhizobium sp. TaxID=1871066 RepID=UPI000FE7B99A|nr:hypothetical protein [Mesorhizobium sp.]RWB83425.1 MAG: hypothetical protein EOQ42_00245 [Mesorhizobium sp.]RWE92160.1 MAG: hypothetical protein EOS43_31450 [Mesorhizobium sp.]RWF88386.1 MAG: hypothetical protein EOQ36_08925 [Mesorhizobium sp.]RWF89305.1 MAG: hypothetical protein EOQ45_31165 [Mesorhizobium sp.]RWO44876.1 MAG: hypothetical protein EOS13_29040 [Mesorhizobium sp.]
MNVLLLVPHLLTRNSAGEDSADNARKPFVAFSKKFGILATDSAGPAWSDHPDDFFQDRW